MTATLLPDPDPRQRHYTIISVDDHLIEPADLFEGRMPARPRRRRAARRHARQRARDLGLRGPLLPAGRAQRGRRPAQGRVEHGAGALRRDAARLLRHRSARRRHGPRRRLREPVLPVAHRRVRGHGLLGEQGPGARARVRCARGTTGTSRSGPAAPRAHHPAAARLAQRPRGRGRRRPRATPSAASRR